MHNIVPTTMNQKKYSRGVLNSQGGIELRPLLNCVEGYKTKKGVLNSQVPPSIDEKTNN